MATDAGTVGGDGWEAQYLRFIAFTAEPQVNKTQTWWQDVVGGESETTSTKFQREEKGSYEGAYLSLLTDIVQVSWILLPAIDPNNPPTLPPVLEGGFPKVRESFSHLILRWLSSCPPVKRLAFNAKLIRYSEGPKDAYQILNGYLPNLKIDPGTSDFLYRINRPRKSRSVDDLSINRLSTWSAVMFRLTVGVHELQTGSSHILSRQEGWHACSVELDINTDHHDPRELAQPRLPQLFRELVTLGTEIAEKGDIP
jgi:hypothetical protein